MQIQDKGRPLHADAQFKIRPRIFLEGNFFVDVTPGTSSKEVADGHVFPVNQTATPVQLDQVLTALQSDTREDLKTVLREYAAGLKGKGAKGFNELDQVLEARLPRLGDRLRGDARREGARPLRLHQPQRRRGRRARPPPRAAQGPDHELPRHRRRVRPREHEPRGGDRRAAAHAARRPARARRAQPLVPRPARLRPRHPPGRRELGGDDRRHAAAAQAAARARLRARAARADLRPAPDRPGARRARPTASVPLSQQVRASASCQNEVILPWSKDTVEDPKFPPTGPVYQELPKPFPGLAGESRSGDANGQWFRVLAAGGTNLVNFGHNSVRHDRAADPRRQPAEADQAPAAERERAVRDAADARPALDPRRAAEAAARPTPRASCSRTAGRRCASTGSI